MFACKACGLDKPTADFRTHKRGYRIGSCRECERAYQREWTARDPEKYRARKRKHMAERRAADPQAARAYGRSYHHSNRDKQTEKMRNYYARRFFWGRAMKLRGPDRATARDLASIWKRQRGLCALTGERLDRSAQVDHKLPKTRGGGNEPANLQWVSASVNYAKRNMTDEEFVTLCGNVMRWIGERIEAVHEIPERTAA